MVSEENWNFILVWSLQGIQERRLSVSLLGKGGGISSVGKGNLWGLGTWSY